MTFYKPGSMFLSMSSVSAPDSTTTRVLDQRNRWACRGGRFAGRVAALDLALAREAEAPGYLEQFTGLWAVDAVVAAHTDDPALRAKPIVHEGVIMPAARAVHRIRRASFRKTRQQATRPARALPVARRTAPRNRSHRAAPRPASKATAPPDSDEPAPGLAGPNPIEIIEKIESGNRREGGNRA